jgi:hypothetical protein
MNDPSSARPELGSMSIGPIKEYEKRWTDRVGNALFRVLAAIGIGPASMLTTTGSRTGPRRNAPVIPVEQGGHLWLVSPYGEVSWLLNARASGQVDLRRGRDVHTCAIRVSAIDGPPPPPRQCRRCRLVSALCWASPDDG